MPLQLIADSGATKCEWCLVNKDETETFFTAGISPYFLNSAEIIGLLQKELLHHLKNYEPDEVYFYGTGLGNQRNVEIINGALKVLFPAAKVEAETDLLAAARALCGFKEGIACILGTGSNSCCYNGQRIIQNAPSLGYILGDEGSGANLGKKVLQHYLCNIFDEELKAGFNAIFSTNQMEILENLYRKPFPNRYLASFAIFPAQNRGHYMIENILEDSFNDFVKTQLYTYNERLTLPVHFTGSIAFAYKDVLQEVCNQHELQAGKILKSPMQGLIDYHLVRRKDSF